MKKFFTLFLIVSLICSLLCGCSADDPKSSKNRDDSTINKYHIKEELIDVYLIDENIEKKLYDFFNLAETSYKEFKKNQDVYQFICSIYDGFDEFKQDFEDNANINERIETDREANRYLMFYYTDFVIAYEPILSLPLEYYENFDDIDETDVVSAVNSISQYFCGVDVFVVAN